MGLYDVDVLRRVTSKTFASVIQTANWLCDRWAVALLVHWRRHVSSPWNSWTCAFSRSDLCSAAISLPCTLIYVSYSHVAGEPTCLPACLPGRLSALRATWRQSGPGRKTSISHRWHEHVRVCQISLMLSFQDMEELLCWHHSGLWRLHAHVFTAERFFNKSWTPEPFPDVPWRL